MTGAPAAAPDQPRPWAGWRRHWQAGIVLIVGLVATAALSVSSAVGYSSNEEKLTRLQTKLNGLVLQTAQAQLSATLGKVVGLAAASNDPEAAFRTAMAGQLTPRGPFTSAALVAVHGDQVTLVDHVGAASLNGANSKSFDDLYVQAAGSPSLLTTRVLAGGVQRLGYLLSARGAGGVYVVGVSQQIPASRRVTVSADSPDAGLKFAVYFGPKVTPAALIETNVAQLPLTGTTAETTVPFGNNVLTFVASPRGSLAGAWSEYLPWALLGGGILLSLGAAAVTDRLIRRRRTAESRASASQELYQQQRSVSEVLQRSLLPKVLPAVPGFEFGYSYVPATQGIEIGGDWYSVVHVDDHRFAVSVGDVSGHGIAAAGAMASLRYTIRTLAALGFPPDEVLSRAGSELEFDDDEQFATVLVGLVDSSRQEIALASAGHLPPLMVTQGHADFVRIPPTLPLGAGEQRPELTTVPFTPGSTLVMYTDGLIETRGESIEAGLEWLSGAALQAPSQPGQLIDHLLKLHHGRGLEDDIAVLAVRFTEQESEVPAAGRALLPSAATLTGQGVLP